MDTWTFIEERKGYYFWKRENPPIEKSNPDGKPYYNVTTTPEPPTTDSGYFSYAHILSVKNCLTN